MLATSRSTIFSLLLVLLAFAPLTIAAPRNLPSRNHAAAPASDKDITPTAQQALKTTSNDSQENPSRLGWVRKFFGDRMPSKSKHCSPSAPTSLFNPTLSSTLSKYKGDVVLRFNLTTAEEGRALAEAMDTLFLDVWEFTNKWADVMIKEQDLPLLLNLLPNSLKTAYSNLMPDLSKSIYQSYPSINPHRTSLPQDPRGALRIADGYDDMFFGEYQPLSVIVPWMNLMEAMYPDRVNKFTIGNSHEGREIPALRIGVAPDSAEPRKTIIISGGLHAREWISVSTVYYIASALIKGYGTSPGVDKLLEEFDFVLIPTLNPDGYVYTWETDRLWRKNRQQANLKLCRGIDLDRAFGFEWDGSTAQANPCSENYQGEEPFQAVEARSLADWAKNESDKNNVKFVGFLDFHSYSQQILYPFSYSCHDVPPSLENLEELGMGLAKAIRLSSREQYSVASACEGAISSRLSSTGKYVRTETGGGSAIDWFYQELKVRHSYQIKLRDTGSYGFLLPKENIVPTGLEAFEAVKYFGNWLLGNRGIERLETESSSDATDPSEEQYTFEADMELRK